MLCASPVQVQRQMRNVTLLAKDDRWQRACLQMGTGRGRTEASGQGHQPEAFSFLCLRVQRQVSAFLPFVRWLKTQAEAIPQLFPSLECSPLLPPPRPHLSEHHESKN